MSARSYLSIGDVLTLLRQEFPDITISKIRFLESQGLVNPERTPSGYRKFYEHDVERLRWVLRQQREHFLPLKVIKDRLEEDSNGTGSAADRSAKANPVAVVAEPQSVVAPSSQERVLVGQRASSSGSGQRSSVGAGSGRIPDVRRGDPVVAQGATISTLHPRVGSNSGSASTGSAASGPSEQASDDSRSTAASRAASGAVAAGASGNGTGSASSSGTGPDVTSGDLAESPEGQSAASGASGDNRPAPRATPPLSSPTVEPAPEHQLEPIASTEVPVSADTAGVSGIGSMGGVSLSLDELTAASGLSAEYVGQLQEFGLLRANVLGGSQFFDEEALTVARVAAKFASLGLEPRHLRLYKNAADREVGLIEQIVLPMVRQRNPEARARANQTAEDMARLGQQLKGSLVRSGLRDLLNG